MLTKLLAEQAMGWRYGADRFLTGPQGGRNWIKHHEFRPLERIEDAFKLLQRVATAYSVNRSPNGIVTATIRIGTANGSASGTCESGAISLAVARALGIKVEGVE
jgi:hypothetical protein